jgi:hypothetical protein
MLTTDPISPEGRKISIRLPRPVSIGVATGVLVVVTVAVRFGLPIYWRQLALNEIQRLHGSTQTTRGGPSWLRKLIGDERMKVFDDVDTISVHGTQLTDASLKTIVSLHEVKSIDLSDSQITDEGLSHVQTLTNLTNVGLVGTRITGAGLIHFKAAPRLIELVLDDTELSDAGLVHLADLSSLEYIRLDRTRVTDAGLKFLSVLANLKELNLDGTPVTDRGAFEFNRNRPKLVIFRHRDGTPSKSRRELQR